MTTTRRIGAVAALGGMTAAVALLAGVSGAQADELSQLRANQQLLQQRLDQLEQQAALGAAPVAPGAPSLAGSFPRSILIPGTNTSLQIGGYVQLDAAYWINGGSPNVSNAASPPVTGVPSAAGAPLRQVGTGLFQAPPFNPRSRSNGIFKMSASESRFFFETRTPTAYGEAITHLELDLFGCTSGGLDCGNLNRSTNADIPRLRLAYGALGPWLIGQNWVPVNDLESHATIFDFGGEAGNFGFARAPQIRYTGELPYGLSYIVAAVTPVTEVFTPEGAIQDDSANNTVAPTGLAVNPTKSSYPDGNFVLKLTRPWGEVQAHGIIHDLKLQDGRFITKEFIGYGGGVSAHMIPFPNSKDNLGFEMYAGNGLGHYGDPATGSSPNGFNSLASNYGGAAVNGYGTCNSTSAACLAIDSRANAARVIARTIPSWGGQVNYQHWWGPTLRSTLSGGIQHQDVPTTLVGLTSFTTSYNKELYTTHVNIMWSPVAFINTGFEWVHGYRKTIFNQTGNENVIDYAFQVRF